MTFERELIHYPCSADGSRQPAWLHRADDGAGARPLIVALHTWSGDYTQNADDYFLYAQAHNCHLIYPDFRGPNWTPAGCGSESAVQDIVDAVAYVKASAQVDEQRIYLIGGSGGGHAALLLAGRAPQLWSAVSAWCPIFDVGAWHGECLGTCHQGYAEHIEAACGGDPRSDARAAEEALRRSPKRYLAAAANLIVDIAAGIHDGHTGSVPVSHALNAYNLLAAPADRLTERDIRFIREHEAIPETLKFTGDEPGMLDHPVLMRRVSGKVRVTIFEGGHNLLYQPGLVWLNRQLRNAAPDWSPLPVLNGRDGELAK